jgi:hypothetical protein
LPTEVSRWRLMELCRSKRALAIPVTFLILFVSTLGIIAVTYYYSIERIDARSVTLKNSMAEQAIGSFDEALSSVLWQSGSSRTLQINDYGGELRVQPSTNHLLVNVTDNNNISDTVFDATVGQVVYELPYSETADTGLFLKGDSRSIVNQSGSVMTQLYIRSGQEHVEIVLRYRLITSAVAYVNEGNTTINDVRIYMVNLSSSQDIESNGEVPLVISCVDVENNVTTYNVSYQTGALTVNANLDGVQRQVSIPISGSTSGTVVKLELIVCDVKIERWIR